MSEKMKRIIQRWKCKSEGAVEAGIPKPLRKELRIFQDTSELRKGVHLVDAENKCSGKVVFSLNDLPVGRLFVTPSGFPLQRESLEVVRVGDVRFSIDAQPDLQRYRKSKLNLSESAPEEDWVIPDFDDIHTFYTPGAHHTPTNSDTTSPSPSPPFAEQLFESSPTLTPPASPEVDSELNSQQTFSITPPPPPPRIRKQQQQDQQQQQIAEYHNSADNI